MGQSCGELTWGGGSWGAGGQLTEAEEEGVHTHPKDAEEAVGDEVGAQQHRLWGNGAVMGGRGAAPGGQQPLVSSPWPTLHGQPPLAKS